MRRDTLFLRKPELAKAYLLNAVKEYVTDAYGVKVARNLEEIVESEWFCKFPASIKHHHTYEGGNIVHVAELLHMALKLAESFEDVNKGELVISIVYHDVGKKDDYGLDKDKEWVPSSNADVMVNTVVGGVNKYTDHKHLVSHLPKSYAVFYAENKDLLTEEELKNIGHNILAHHGRREWGSPVEPQTTEAAIIHSCDMLSACYSSNNCHEWVTY